MPLKVGQMVIAYFHFTEYAVMRGVDMSCKVTAR